MTFAANLQRRREALNLSVPEAARLCNVALSTWYGYEAGSTTPPLETLLVIAARLKTTAAELLKGVKVTQ